MTPAIHLATDRLLLRDWSGDDAAPFAALNADPEVMEFFPKPLSRAESDGLMASAEAAIAANGFGLYAIEVKETGAFIGFVGLATPRFEAHFTPAIEIGWRLTRSAWGQGLATEAAHAVLDHAFGPLGLGALVSFTTVGNLRSRSVMERIGMTRDPADDFMHPSLPSDHPLAPHVLCRINRERWREARRQASDVPSTL